MHEDLRKAELENKSLRAKADADSSLIENLQSSLEKVTEVRCQGIEWKWKDKENVGGIGTHRPRITSVENMSQEKAQSQQAVRSMEVAVEKRDKQIQALQASVQEYIANQGRLEAQVGEEIVVLLFLRMDDVFLFFDASV